MSALLRNAILGFIFCSACCICPVAARAYKANVGDRAAPFTGYDIVHHRSVDLEDYAGRWIFVEFWASWCGPCIHELPNMVRETSPYVNSGELAVVTVSVDEASDLPALKKVVRKFRMPYPVIYDGDSARSEDDLRWGAIPANEWGVGGVPASYLLNPQGVVVATEIRGAKLAATLDFYLHGNRPAMGLRGRQVLHTDGSISVFAEIYNPGREDVKVSLYTYDVKMIWDDQSKSYKDHTTYADELIQSATASIDSFCETTHEFVIPADENRYIIIPRLKVTVPNTEHIGDSSDPGILLEWEGDELMLLDIEYADGKYSVTGRMIKQYPIGYGWKIESAP